MWRALVYINLINSHGRVDEGVNIGNCRMNRLLFADKLVLHAWIFSTRSSAHIRLVLCCVWPSRNENQLYKDWGFVSLKTPKAVFSASKWKYTAAGGDCQVPWVVLTSDGSRNKEIVTRSGEVNAVLRDLYCSEVAKRELSKTAKLSVFKSVFVPILTYGHES